MDFGPGGLENILRPSQHIGEDLHVVLTPCDVPARDWQPVLVLTIGVEADVVLRGRQHLPEGHKPDEGGITLLHRFLKTLAETGNRAGPTNRTAVLKIKLDPEAARIIPLALMHEGRD